MGIGVPGVAAVEQAVGRRGQLDHLRGGGQVQVDAQGGAIAQAPACGQGLVAVYFGTQRAAAGQVRDHMAAAQFEQVLVQAVPAGDHFPGLRAGGLEGLFGVGVGDALALLGVGEGGEMGELAAPAFAHGVGQLVMEVGEEQERPAAAIVVAHEQQRNHRRQQQQPGGRPQRLRWAQTGQALAQGAVADLVMVLQEQHESAGWQVRAGLAAGRAMAVGLALEHETFGKAAGQLVDGALLVVGVVAFGFAGQQHMQGIVAVVVPLGIEALLQQEGLVVFVLQYQPYVAARFHRSAYPLRQLDQKVGLVDGVHGIQAQAVKAVVAQPHQGVLDEELAHLRATEVDGCAPGVCRSSRKNGLAYWCR